MTQVNQNGNLLDTTLAGMIAKVLDSKDAQDGICKSIWDSFVGDKGGKTINSRISAENAMNSITTYLVRQAKTLGTSVNELAKEWLAAAKSMAATSGTPGAGVAQAAGVAQTAYAAQNTDDTQAREEAIQKGKDLLAEIANMNPKPEVETGHNDEKNYDWATVKLPDGRWVMVKYLESGEISEISTSYDTTPNHLSDGTTYDGAEVSFEKDKTYYDTDRSNSTFEGHVENTAKDFRTLTDIADKIFGKKLPANLRATDDKTGRWYYDDKEKCHYEYDSTTKKFIKRPGINQIHDDGYISVNEQESRNLGAGLYKAVKGLGTSIEAYSVLNEGINKYNAFYIISEFNKLSANDGESITKFLYGEHGLTRRQVIKPAKEYLSHVKEKNSSLAESQEYKALESAIQTYENDGGAKNADSVDAAIKVLMKKADLDLTIQVGVPEGTADKENVQATFDKATKMLCEVANMNPKPEIKKGHNDTENYDWAYVNLPDGRGIAVYYDENREISDVHISHDTTPIHRSDGTTSDVADVNFKKDKACYETDYNNDRVEGNITTGYDFEAIKAIAKMIFG